MPAGGDEQRRRGRWIRHGRQVDPGVPERDGSRGVQVGEDGPPGVGERGRERRRGCVLHADEAQPVAVGRPGGIRVRRDLADSEPALVLPEHRPLGVGEGALPLSGGGVEVGQVPGRQHDALVVAATEAVPEPARRQGRLGREQGVVGDSNLIEKCPQGGIVGLVAVSCDQEQLQPPRCSERRDPRCDGTRPRRAKGRRRAGPTAREEVGGCVLWREGESLELGGCPVDSAAARTRAGRGAPGRACRADGDGDQPKQCAPSERPTSGRDRR